jgi:DNA-binding response OmpR family regulator
MRVLVAEDEVRLARLLAQGLRRRGMAVDVATDGRAALGKVAVVPYDVVVLDRDLPLLHGDEVCRAVVRDHPGTRVIMLTASSTITDRVDGLGLGADDYLAKPFAFAELAARVLALGRRSGPPRPPTIVRGDLELDPATMRVTRRGTEIVLNAKEFAVLHHLMRADGAVVSAEELLTHVWDEHADPFTATVRVTIYRLRRKLGEPSPVETIANAGYRVP